MSYINGKIVFYMCGKCGSKTEPLIAPEHAIIPPPDTWSQKLIRDGEWINGGRDYEPPITIEYCEICTAVMNMEKSFENRHDNIKR